MWQDQSLSTGGSSISVTSSTSQRYNYYVAQNSPGDSDEFETSYDETWDGRKETDNRERNG